MVVSQAILDAQAAGRAREAAIAQKTAAAQAARDAQYAQYQQTLAANQARVAAAAAATKTPAPVVWNPLPTAAPAKQTITIPDAKADAGYQKTLADTARSMVDFKSQQGLVRSQYDTQNNDAARHMGFNAGTGQFDRAAPGAFKESYDANENDFASRGMLHSGGYGTTTGDITRDFADRKSTLDRSRADSVNTQQQALTGFQGQTDSTNNAALSDAVGRIASQYAITPQQVPQGRTSTITR